jgi:hypothetical protein
MKGVNRFGRAMAAAAAIPIKMSINAVRKVVEPRELPDTAPPRPVDKYY